MKSVAERLSLPSIHWGWLLVAAIVSLFFYSARGILGPFIAGFIIAYLLDPVVSQMERRSVPRPLATALALAGFVAVIVGIIAAMAPLVEAQLLAFVESLPSLFERLRAIVVDFAARFGLRAQLDATISNLAQRAAGYATGLIGTVVASGLQFFNVLGLVIVTPVVAFYVLRDFDVVGDSLSAGWPPRYAATIRKLLKRMDRALSGFLRGQLVVCLVLACFYTVGWGLVGLDYFVVLGVLAGLFGFVPYVGVVVAVGLSLLVALGQWGFDPIHLGLVIGVFFLGQLLESTVLTPNLIGNRIGLHPVWVLFAVFAGGELFGFVGVLFAVPVAAVIGVLVRYLAGRYLDSELYLGRNDVDTPA